MQYVWQHRLWTPADMTTVDGLRVTVVDPGLLNTGSGPDFFNAKIEIGGKMWAGNVEIHVRASDWHRHGHDGDHAYDSVILHVVDRDDARIMRPGGCGEIPQLVMPCSPDFSRRYSEMVDRPLSELACAGELPSLPGVHLTAWLDSLAIERLSRKAERILELVRHFEGHWAPPNTVLLQLTGNPISPSLPNILPCAMFEQIVLTCEKSNIAVYFPASSTPPAKSQGTS